MAAVTLFSASAYSADDCENEETAKLNVQRLESDIVKMREQRKVQEEVTEKKIDEVAGGLVQKGVWTSQNRANFFSDYLRSSDFKSHERQKKTELGLFALSAQTMLSYKDKGNYKEACISANGMRRLLTKIGQINDEQYRDMLTKAQSIAP